MESKWLKDSLFAGITSNAFKLGTVLSLGWFWMRVAGCHTVYRGQDGNMDYGNVHAVMEPGDSQVTIPNQALPAGTIWHYIRRQVSGCGLESPDSPACIIPIDSDGDMVPSIPNPPLHLTAKGLSNGRVLLRWRYSRVAQEIAPDGFYIYIDSGSGFDFDNPAADVSCSGRAPVAGGFKWTSDPLSHGQLYRFCVRAYRLGDAGWLSPTTHSGAPCLHPELVYDDNEETPAWFQDIPNESWSGFLDLIGAKIVCDKVRILAKGMGPDTIDVDAYYNGAWNHVFEGAITDDIWAEYFLTTPDQVAIRSRVRFYNDVGYPADVYFYEFDFWGALIYESQNTEFVALFADAEGPDAITGLQASWEEM